MGSEIGTGRTLDGLIVPWWVGDDNARRFLDAPRHERYLWLWRECVTRARSAASFAEQRYLEIRYEALCADPAATGRKLLEFLDIEDSRRFRKTMGQARTASIGIARQGKAVREPGWEPVTSLLRELGYAR